MNDNFHRNRRERGREIREEINPPIKRIEMRMKYKLNAKQQQQQQQQQQREYRALENEIEGTMKYYYEQNPKPRDK